MVLTVMGITALGVSQTQRPRLTEARQGWAFDSS